MKKAVFFILVLVMLIGLPACSHPVSGQLIQSDLSRDTNPSVSQTDLAELVAGNSDFAFDLLQVLHEDGGNLFYSPLSISEALAMTYAGARGDTESEMAAALSFTLPQERLHPAFNSLDLQLNQRGQGAAGKDDEGFRLNVVNAIWGQQDYKFLDSYLDVLAENYGAGLRLVDFIRQTEESRQTINSWVSEQTEDKIKDLIPEGVIDDLTRLVLTNAVYFNAAWMYPFDEKKTGEGTFHTLNGLYINVPMMHQTGSFRYTEGTNYQAIELPYDGGELAMTILLPDSGEYDTFLASLDAAMFTKITDNLATSEVILSLPKFEYEAALGLKDALSQMGMGTAFTYDADFSGMTGNRELYIQDVVHKAFISVDEAGAEAAAATAVIVGLKAAPVKQVEFTVDRPFIFVIRDIPTGTIVFMGAVENI